MKIVEKSACSFDQWYPKLKKWSVSAELEPIPDDVLEFLRSDIVTVPVEASVRRKLTSYIDDITYKNWDSDDEGDVDDEISPPSFPAFSARLSECMERLGGGVFVKLNWSAPTDAAWMATNSSLKCTNLQDLYLLLKSSGKISDDLEIKGQEKYYVVMKKWLDIHPGTEFRCFVSNGELIAISQRNNTEFHEHFQENVCSTVGNIKSFYYTKVKENFDLNCFVMDVIYTENSIKIVDINTFEESTNPGLFSWSELKDMEYVEGVSPEFRYISEDIGIQPARHAQHFGLPIDLTELSEEKSQSIIELLQAQVLSQRQED
ncbi:Hypothetical protein NTJ_08191 [Nesidiocoris tenuis]|uniref:Cell division cycle protein 123 homolog n=1 Tax=Nesidiocoris tenuis TaxID=355587 RepID=A0ABN7AT65_9HEMI|nr:Hypothetical protein NTJ_08191 [Nesidiocoris tenuis]